SRPGEGAWLQTAPKDPVLVLPSVKPHCHSLARARHGDLWRLLRGRRRGVDPYVCAPRTSRGRPLREIDVAISAPVVLPDDVRVVTAVGGNARTIRRLARPIDADDLIRRPGAGGRIPP